MHAFDAAGKTTGRAAACRKARELFGTKTPDARHSFDHFPARDRRVLRLTAPFSATPRASHASAMISITNVASVRVSPGPASR